MPEERFAWGYFLTAIAGIVLIIAVVCTLANTFKKAPAAMLDRPAATALA